MGENSSACRNRKPKKYASDRQPSAEIPREMFLIETLKIQIIENQFSFSALRHWFILDTSGVRDTAIE